MSTPGIRFVHDVMPDTSHAAGQQRVAIVTANDSSQVGMILELSVFKRQAGEFGTPTEFGHSNCIVAESDTHAVIGSVFYDKEQHPGTWHAATDPEIDRTPAPETFTEPPVVHQPGDVIG